MFRLARKEAQGRKNRERMRKIIKGKHIKPASNGGTACILPAKEGTCEWCATEHVPEFPHNASSLFYQYRFYNEHGRWPNWKDAMKHCDAEMQKAWTYHLEKQGINVNAGETSGE